MRFFGEYLQLNALREPDAQQKILRISPELPKVWMP